MCIKVGCTYKSLSSWSNLEQSTLTLGVIVQIVSWSWSAHHPWLYSHFVKRSTCFLFLIMWKWCKSCQMLPLMLNSFVDWDLVAHHVWDCVQCTVSNPRIGWKEVRKVLIISGQAFLITYFEDYDPWGSESLQAACQFHRWSLVTRKRKWMRWLHSSSNTSMSGTFTCLHIFSSAAG